jgi:voltage-dependent potassium channel beta subunit
MRSENGGGAAAATDPKEASASKRAGAKKVGAKKSCFTPEYCATNGGALLPSGRAAARPVLPPPARVSERRAGLRRFPACAFPRVCRGEDQPRGPAYGVRYRNIGRWGLKVSTVGLGSWLTYGGNVEETIAAECVARAYDLGVTFFDTANVYARGRAEQVVGRALAGYRRESYVLATKVYFPMGDGPNDRGLSRKHVFEQCGLSLRRLGVDYIDLYQCHRFDPLAPLEETCAAMNDLVRQGQILYWGVSEWNADQIVAAVTLCRARGWAEPISNQPQYSALWRRIEARVLPVCAEYGLGSVVWSPLAMGILTGKYADAAKPPAGTRAAGASADMMEDYFTQPVLDAVAQLAPLAREANATPAQLALAWCLRRREISSVIVGATKIQQVEDNAAAADLDVDPAIFARMDAILSPVAPSEPYLS